MALSETPTAALSAAPPEVPRNQTEVYAVHGADPEVLAYAMAKYSRSALSMKESLREISNQRAEHFLNTFYFQYGHRSIADLAHVPIAVERLSLLAAITECGGAAFGMTVTLAMPPIFSTARPRPGSR